MSIRHLEPHQLRRQCDPTQFNFSTTAELQAIDTIIGQPRALKAIEFGLKINSDGYNIFAIGESGPELMTTLERFVNQHARQQNPPNDWIYVHNFEIPHQPRAIMLPAGEGRQFQTATKALIEKMKGNLTKAFEDETYRTQADQMRQWYKNSRDDLLQEMRVKTGQDGLTVVNTASGLVIMPLVEGRAMSNDEYNQLPIDEHQSWEKKRQAWDDELDEVYRKLRELDIETRDKMQGLEREVATTLVTPYFDELRESYTDFPAVHQYLDDVFNNVLDHLSDFFPPENEEEKDERRPDLRRFEINVLIDNHDAVGAPVISELNPRYSHLIGRVEYEAQHFTHFTNIKAGSLLKANGGYLILNIRDVLHHRNAWEALKRALKTGEIRLQSNDRTDGNQILAKSLDPEPIPLQVKVILLGSADQYYRLFSHEDSFNRLFKVKAEFNPIMPRNHENECAYAAFIATRCQDEELLHFDCTAVAEIINFGSRMSGHQEKLTTRFEWVSDIIRESHFWAIKGEQSVVLAEHVKQALTEWRHRVNLEEDRVQEAIQKGTLAVQTTGDAVGQVNGLSIIDHGDYAYGQPDRISARTYMGERGVINIDREVDLTGPLHHKGLLALTGYLGGQYAQNRALTLSASISFEQNHGPIDGDSASSTELYALLSSLANLPIKQSIAVTGAVSQKGEILPIGGVNQKIEGFFYTCKARGLTGEQGVIIPGLNQIHLNLNDDVTEAVASGQFHIWAIDSIEDGMTLLTGIKALPADGDGEFPSESLHARVLEGLARLDKDEDEDDEDED
ncbi:MAG: ATP-binding protein [Ardenticatenaceae bacterium]|nr:ATP-binding protein [Ardenticatenaceae bacterium]